MHSIGVGCGLTITGIELIKMLHSISVGCGLTIIGSKKENVINSRKCIGNLKVKSIAQSSTN